MRKKILLFLFAIPFVTLDASNLIPGDTSVETEAVSAGNGCYGAMIYGLGSQRLFWDRSTGFDGASSLQTRAADVYSLQKSVVLQKGKTYTFSFYAKARRNGVRGQINCVPSDLRQWPHPGGGRAIVYTTQWKRYQYTFTAPRNVSCSGIYRVYENKEKVNFDAFMLNEGREAKPYSPAADFTVGISHKEIPGNILYLNEGLDLTVSVRRTKEQGNCRLRICIRNKHGQLLKEYNVTPVFDRSGLFRFKTRYKPVKTGYFEVEAQTFSGEGTTGKDFRTFVATVPAEPLDRSVLPFTGICSLYTPAEIFHRLGASWRYFAQDFSYAAAREGKIVVYGMGGVKRDKEAGLSVKMMINMHPPMRLMSAEEKASLKKYGVSPVRFVPGKNAIPAWKEFMEELVDKFHKYVDVWEFGGELDARFGLNPYYKNKYPEAVKGPFVLGDVTEQTAELIRIGAGIIRKKNPHAVITAVRPCDVDCRSNFLFSDSIYSKLPGVLNSFGLDSYARPRRIGPKEPFPGPVTDLIEQYKSASKLLTGPARGAKNIFISEFGYELMFDAIRDRSLLQRYAICLAQSHLMARAAGFTSMAFYTSLGMREAKSTYAHWIGVNPLPSVATYCHIGRFLRNVKRAEYAIPTTDCVVTIYEKTNGSACGALWTCNPETTPLVLMDPVRMTDMDGLDLSMKPVKGKVRFPVRCEPVLFYAKDYAAAEKILKNMKFIRKDPLKVDFRMKTKSLVKMYLSSRTGAAPTRCIFTFRNKKYDILVPGAESVLVELPVSREGEKISLTLDFPELEQKMKVDYVIPEIVTVPKISKAFPIDGTPDKWKKYPALAFASSELIYPIDVFGWHGKDDLSVRLNLAHDGTHFYIFAAVKDDHHCNKHPSGDIAKGDIFQIAFDPKTNSYGLKKDQKMPDDTNMALALSAGRVIPVFYYGVDRQLFAKSNCAVRRDEKSKTTFYEWKIPLTSLGLDWKKEHVFGFSGVVFDDDSNTRWDYYMDLYPGITRKFDPSRFGLFVLQK